MRKLVNMSDEVINTMMHSRKPQLFNNTDMQINKNANSDFDVRMRSFDGVELSKLVDLHFLHILGEKYGKHRQVCITMTGQLILNKAADLKLNQKKICYKVFKEDFDLSITFKTNLKVLNFLDGTLYLTNGKHQPYSKQVNPSYINDLSNHAANIIKNLASNMHKRISNL